MRNITVIGFGSWGIALACLLAKNGHAVTLWEDNAALAQMLEQDRENKKFLPGVVIPDSIKITHDAMVAAKNAEMFVFVVTSRAVEKAAEVLAPYFKGGQILVSASKGLIEDRQIRICQYLEEIAPSCTVACLTGPSHAEEVGRHMPTAVVAASHCEKTAEAVQDAFSGNDFRVYTTTDVVGAELGGAIKNVIALAAGIADGLGFGDNTKAALMTRGSAEITRLGVAMGADAHTFAGLSGIGDLIVTCTSRHSRNWRGGNLLATGKSMADVQKEVGMVVEGMHTAKAALALARKYSVDMPIVEEINKILFEGKDPKKAVGDLMLRDKKDEHV
ncbi:MAG: NAD(P)-dependent glycerol-3-phosphate dehydrogenase [Defluviitaleaceae bacterium]|nr:NAD(P)-dependent glycerol-3-phosphate dehydrogenase [Defluviitaleaceae bacterium]